MKRIILFLLPKRFDAITLFSNVYAREGASEQLLNHEAVHAEQQHKEPVMFYVRYLFNRKARMHYEAEAYATSMQYGMSLSQAAHNLSFDYRLNTNMFASKAIIESYL